MIYQGGHCTPFSALERIEGKKTIPCGMRKFNCYGIFRSDVDPMFRPSIPTVVIPHQMRLEKYWTMAHPWNARIK